MLVDVIKGGWVNLLLLISPDCGQGGRGSKIQKILRTSFMDSPLPKTWRQEGELRGFESGEGPRGSQNLKILRASYVHRPVLLANVGIPEFDQTLSMSRLSPIYIQDMSRVGPCPIYDRYLSSKSNFSPVFVLMVQLMSLFCYTTRSKISAKIKAKTCACGRVGL